MLLVMVGMNWAGLLGAPRKTFDPALGDAASQWITPMNLMGLGGVVAVIGGAAFVVNVLWSLWWHQREPVHSPALKPIPGAREAL
jgi:heme/copper-type cytochrome/quinol oxidase subunit 1